MLFKDLPLKKRKKLIFKYAILSKEELNDTFLFRIVNQSYAEERVSNNGDCFLNEKLVYYLLRCATFPSKRHEQKPTTLDGKTYKAVTDFYGSID